jgi:transcription elongation factor GreA
MSSDHQIYLTPEGYNRIERELERLRTVDRREVADRIRESKQFGEFTENAEYEDAKIEQAFVEGRIQDLKRIIQIAHVLSDSDIPTDEVGIGSRVKVLDLDTNEEWDLQVVGSVESDPNFDRISDESPVGEALMGHKVGDEVEVAIPDGTLRYRILQITK